MPFEELFAHEYQPEYISLHGDINVGPYKYNVFKTYSVAERQKAFQDCKKFLNWQLSEVQGEWELCMYMYQWIIKSPYPFPYSEYSLSEEITMAINYDININNVNVLAKRADVTVTRTDTESALAPQTYSFQNTPVAGATSAETTAIRVGLLNTVKAKVVEDDEKQTTIEAMITDLEQTAKSILEAWEATR